MIGHYLKREKIPILWKRIFMKLANDRDILYNRPKRFLQHCREKLFFKFNDCRSIN